MIAELAQGRPYDPNAVCGYSEREVGIIERLYDIVPQGILRKFLLEMGRCSGGLIGDDPLILYRPGWDVRTQLLHQLVFFEEMQEAAHWGHLAAKPFTFACESETQHYFVDTAADSPDRVLRFDENTGLVHDTGQDLFAYLSRGVATWTYQQNVVYRGELVVI